MKDRRLHVVSVLVAALLFAAVSPLAAGVLTGNCVVGERPAATLLFPYFEVELTNPAGRTTLIAINNRNTVFPVLARVTLWTDWGVPTYGFTLFLASNDVQTINVRDLFTTGNSPTTGPGAAIFPGCNNSLGTNIAPALLRTAHTGQNTLGSCFGSGILGPNVATGYITVDASARCPVPNGGGSDSPGDAGYFTGAGAIAVTDNVLWGDWFLVTPDQAFATGNPAVHIQADPDFFGAGDYTTDLGITWTLGEDELASARSEFVLASRAAGLEPPSGRMPPPALELMLSMTRLASEVSLPFSSTAQPSGMGLPCLA